MNFMVERQLSLTRKSMIPMMFGERSSSGVAMGLRKVKERVEPDWVKYNVSMSSQDNTSKAITSDMRIVMPSTRSECVMM